MPSIPAAHPVPTVPEIVRRLRERKIAVVVTTCVIDEGVHARHGGPGVVFVSVHFPDPAQVQRVVAQVRGLMLSIGYALTGDPQDHLFSVVALTEPPSALPTGQGADTALIDRIPGARKAFADPAHRSDRRPVGGPIPDSMPAAPPGRVAGRDAE